MAITSILVVSAGVFHPSLLARFQLWRALNALHGYDYQRIESLESLPDLALGTYQSIVLYYHHDTISAAALERLEGYLDAGGGLFALHSAAASFKDEPRYADLLGGRFVSHGPVEQFEIRPHDTDLFAGIGGFTAYDELYRHEYDRVNNRVHFAIDVDGQAEPLVWTRERGAGRVCYCALGHVAASFKIPQVRAILARGLAWTAHKTDGAS